MSISHITNENTSIFMKTEKEKNSKACLYMKARCLFVEKMFIFIREGPLKKAKKRFFQNLLLNELQ